MRALKDGWNDDDIVALSAAPIEEYRDAFKAVEGAELRKMLSGALQFDRIANATDGMREISRRAREALRLIGGEFAINARRVRSLGVIVPQPGNPAQPAQPADGRDAHDDAGDGE